MKCLVVGGAGFLGSHLVERLLEEGHAVRVFDRQAPGRASAYPRAGEVEWITGELLDRDALRAALAGCEAAFHLAWSTLPKSSNEDPAGDVRDNVGGTLRLLETWRGSGGRLVFVSSGGTVYGVPRSVPIAEDHPTDPICSYGVTKLAAEKYLELYRVLHGQSYCVLRIANAFGPRQRVASGQGAVSAFLDRARRAQPLEIWGDGSVVRDYVYAGDVARALVSALHYRGEQRVINVGSGAGRDLNQIAAAIEQVIGRPVERRYLPGRAFDVPANVLDIRLARAALGWEPRTSFEDGLRLTLRSLASE
jgi:UDP-glucose 4-epimerase